MKYSTETMQKLAQMMSEMIKTAVKQQMEEKEEQPTITEIEQGMRECLREIGQESLGMVLSGLQKTPEQEIACKCGGKLR